MLVPTKSQCKEKFAALLVALVLVSVGALILGQKVSAAAGGSITGTVKLSGTAPHLKGIDMSKDPFCVKQHENSPAKMGRTWWWDKVTVCKTLPCTSRKG